MAKMSKKMLIVHLDRFSGSGPVTEEQIIATVEAAIPGATTDKKFKIERVTRKKDNELIKLILHFSEQVPDVIINSVANDTYALAGVLDPPAAFPVLISQGSDDFESYNVGDDIIASSAGKWILQSPTPIDQANPPTFTCQEDLVWAGDKGALLELKKESSNSHVSIEADFVAPSETDSLRFEKSFGLTVDPLSGMGSLYIGKLGALIAYGSTYYDATGPDAIYNGKLVLFSKDPVTLLEKKTILGNMRYGVMYKWLVNAEVDGLYFDSNVISQDNVDTFFSQAMMQTEGIVQADLQSGTLKVGMYVHKAPSVPQGGGEANAYITASDENDYTLGIPTDNAEDYGTALKLNSVSPYGGSNGDAYIEGGPCDDFWNGDLSAWSFEMRGKADPSGIVIGGVGLSIGKVGEPGSILCYMNYQYFGAYLFDASGSAIMALDMAPVTYDYVDLDGWNHMLVQWTGTNLEVYHNAILKVRVPFAGPMVTPATNRFAIGQQIQSATPGPISAHYIGYIDEVRISDIARFTGAMNIGDPANEGLGAISSDANTIRLFHLNEPEVAGETLTLIADDSPQELPSADVKLVTDEISTIAEG